MSKPSPKPDCPLCRANKLLKESVIADTKGAYLMRAHSSPDNFLIVPDLHAEIPTQLPDDLWGSIKNLLNKIPQRGENYNISINIGATAGQTVRHIHFWVIPRAAGKPSSGKGLARLLSEANNSR